jgi:hypothetical protein
VARGLLQDWLPSRNQGAVAHREGVGIESLGRDSSKGNEMTEQRDKEPDQLTALRRKVVELEQAIEQRDASIRQCEAVIRKLRERVGNGFRGEVLAFSDSIKSLLS